MRLTTFEIKIITQLAKEIWGAKVEVYLFGSRTDDSKKGGDIDLFIRIKKDPSPKRIMLQKAEFLGKLDILLGEQKIDLLIQTDYNEHLPIMKTANLTGIKL